MISSKTLNIDNPKLNCRLKSFEKFSPKRIILDNQLNIKLDSYIFKSAKKNNTIIFHDSLNKKKMKILEKKGIVLIKSKTNKELFDLKTILKKLYVLGTRNLLVEGGDKITKKLIENRLFDKFYLFKSTKKLLTDRKHQIFTSFSILNKNYKKKSKISSKLVKDNISIYKR